MPLPKKLTLFGIPWKIKLFKPTGWLSHEHRGMTVFGAKEIHILQDSNEKSTLLHELIHVAEEMTSAGLTEAQVVALERGLWNIFETNPQLLTYFNERTTKPTNNSTIVQAILELGRSSNDDPSDHGYEREI